MKAVILGGGFAGCTVAHLLHRAGWETTLIEKEPHLGGGCRTFFHAGHPFTYGPRVYYGYSEKVFQWVNDIVPIRRFPFELRTLAHEPIEENRRFWTYPMHEADIPHYPRSFAARQELDSLDNSVEPKDFEDYWLRRVGKTLYDMFVDHYSKKMWMVSDNRVFDIFKWSAKDRPIESGSREAYKGSYIGYPIARDGYNSYFDRMVAGTEVIKGETASLQHNGTGQHEVWISNAKLSADAIISTIPIDELCGHSLGELPYVGRDFHLVVLPCKQVFPGDVRFCHYASDQDEWTRITEFKKLSYHESESTLLVLEKPSKNNKLYPYLTKANMALTQRYLESLPANVHSIGRLGTYKYSTIENTIAQAGACAAKLTGQPNELADQFFAIGDVAMLPKDRKQSAI